MFDLLLLNLRSQGLKVGLGEWLVFLEGLKKELVTDLDGLYRFGRAVLVHSETQYDTWDLAFTATFDGVQLPPVLSEQLTDWLAEAMERQGEMVEHDLHACAQEAEARRAARAAAQSTGSPST